jgi:predicted nucleic acid-binding protein
MKEKIIVDTNVITQYLRTGKGVLPMAYEKYEMWIPATTYAELLASSTFEDANLRDEVMEFTDKYFKVVEISKDVAIKAGEIVRQHGMTMTTALLLASCLVSECKLLSEEPDNYKKVEGLMVAAD